MSMESPVQIQHLDCLIVQKILKSGDDDQDYDITVQRHLPQNTVVGRDLSRCQQEVD